MDLRIVESSAAVLAAYINMDRGEVLLQLVLWDRLDAFGALDELTIRVVELHVPLLVADRVESSNVAAAARGRILVHFVSGHMVIVSDIFFFRHCTEFLPAGRTHPLRNVAIDEPLEEPRSQCAFEDGLVPEWDILIFLLFS